jgi:tetratricopeptide (TPR) repeat protein
MNELDNAAVSQSGSPKPVNVHKTRRPVWRRRTWIRDSSKWAKKNWKIILLLLVAFVFIYVTVERYSTMIIEPFEVPSQYINQGYPPSVFSQRVIYNIRFLEATIHSQQPKPEIAVASELPKIQDFRLPGTQLSIAGLVDTVLDVLNRQPKHFGGEVKLSYCESGDDSKCPATITFHVSGRGVDKRALAVSVALRKSDPETAARESAVWILSRLDPYTLGAYMGLVLGDVVDAQRALQPILDEPSHYEPSYLSRVYSLWGAVLSKNGRIDEGARMYQKAIDLDPKNAEPWDNWAIDRARVGDKDGALGKFEKAIEANPTSSVTLQNWCGFLSQQGRFNEALEKCHASIAVDPSNARAYNTLGGTLLMIGKNDESIDYFRKAIQYDEGWSEPYTNWGSALRQMGHFHDAETKYRKASELDPLNPNTYLNWSGVLFNLHEYDQSINKAKIAVQLAPNLQPALDDLLKGIEKEKKKGN